MTDRAARLWAQAIIVDGHNDLPTRILDDAYDPDVRHAPGSPPDRGDSDLPRFVESGITAQFLIAFVDGKFAREEPDRSFARANVALDAIHAFAARHPRVLALSTTAADVRRAKEEGKLAVFIGVEGGHAIEDSLDNLRALHRRGARCLTLTWNNGNAWAGSSIGDGGTRTGGLTAFGADVIREMNRLGMLVDLSHASDATFFDVASVSRDPVIASHSNARRLAPSPRNVTDDQLRAVAASGGVVGVNFFAMFIDPAYFAEKTRIEEMVARQIEQEGDDPATAVIKARHDPRAAALIGALRPPPISALVDHIDHMVQVAGIDHVALGSDFDGVGGLLPAGLHDVTQLPRLVDELIARRYDDDAILKILGGNLLRVMTRVLDRG